jgi:hypothetical protein
MNRIVCDAPYSGFHHRYCLGYYDIMKRLTEGFPQVLFEGCCSGGGRFDPGVLSFMPQIWTSDNTDAVCRLKIQYSTSMCYPLSTMGAHVSAAPNHQTGRITSLQTRAAVAYTGMFGYELDVTRMSREELQQMAKQTEFAKHIQPLILSGELYRLRSPYGTNECAWQVVSGEKDHVFVMTCRILTVIRNEYFEPRIKLRGLDPDGIYTDVVTGERYSGSLLMHRGLTFRYPTEDFATYLNNYSRKINEKGASFYYHLCPVNELSVVGNAVSGSSGMSGSEGAAGAHYFAQQCACDFYAHLDKVLDLPLLGDPRDSVMEAGWFYDTNFHLNLAGKTVFTRQLVRDLKAALGDTSLTEIEVPAMPRTLAFTQLSDEEDAVLKRSTYAGNTEITQITVPETVRRIEDGAFDGCTSLKAIYLDSAEPSQILVGRHLLDGTEADLFVPVEALSAYRTDYRFSQYADRIQAR